MPYQQEVSRAHPSCILFLLDQSGSMSDAFGASEQGTKAEGVATAVNRLIQTLVSKCAKDEGVRDYYTVGAIGYGGEVGSAFGGELAGQGLVPISRIADNPLRVERRTKVTPDGVGGLVEESIVFPVWFDARTYSGTPMRAAFYQAHEMLSEWVDAHPESFPPIVINITDGESTDGDPSEVAADVARLATSDGNTLVFNIHCSSLRNPPIEFPDDEVPMPDHFASLLYQMSSVLPPHLREAAGRMGYRVSETTRGFVFNADLTAVIRAIDIGTRPTNLR